MYSIHEILFPTTCINVLSIINLLIKSMPRKTTLGGAFAPVSYSFPSRTGGSFPIIIVLESDRAEKFSHGETRD